MFAPGTGKSVGRDGEQLNPKSDHVRQRGRPTWIDRISVPMTSRILNKNNPNIELRMRQPFLPSLLRPSPFHSDCKEG